VSTPDSPTPVYLQHMPEWVVRRLDELYSKVESGSVTLHKNGGEALKIEWSGVERLSRPK
jgi:hypothetical protein